MLGLILVAGMMVCKGIVVMGVGMGLSIAVGAKIMDRKTRKIKTNLDSNPLFYCNFLFISRELINGELQEEVSNAERKVIGLKIIQFYEKKIERDDFSNVNPENLMVWNFSHKRPELCSIRKVGTSAYEEGEKTQ